MKHVRFARLPVPAALLVLSLPLAAQTVPAAAGTRAAAAHASSSVVEAPRSAMAGFSRWQPDTTGPGWRSANDEVGRLRGHVGQARAAAAASPPPAVDRRPATLPEQGGPADHAGHHGPGAAR